MIGRGCAEVIDDVQEKIKGLSLLMKNKTGQEFTINEQMASTVELAKLLHIADRSSISFYETNSRTVPMETANKIAKMFDSSINFILEGEEPEDPLLDKLMQLWKSVESKDVKNMILAQVEKAVELDQKIRKEKDEENQYDSSCNS